MGAIVITAWPARKWGSWWRRWPVRRSPHSRASRVLCRRRGVRRRRCVRRAPAMTTWPVSWRWGSSRACVRPAGWRSRTAHWPSPRRVSSACRHWASTGPRCNGSAVSGFAPAPTGASASRIWVGRWALRCWRCARLKAGCGAARARVRCRSRQGAQGDHGDRPGVGAGTVRGAQAWALTGLPPLGLKYSVVPRARLSRLAWSLATSASISSSWPSTLRVMRVMAPSRRMSRTSPAW